MFVILNYILDYIYSRFTYLLRSWNQYVLQLTKLALYCNIIHQKGARLLNCAGFVDGKILRISRPKINQNIVYNGHRVGYKQAHGIKFQNLALLIDLLVILVASVWKNDMIVSCFMGLGCSQIYRDQHGITISPSALMATQHISYPITF